MVLEAEFPHWGFRSYSAWGRVETVDIITSLTKERQLQQHY